MDLLDSIKNYWQILLLVGGIIVSWTRYESKNNAQDRDIQNIEKRLAYTEQKLEAHTQTTNTLTNDIAIIKTTLEYIKMAIEEIKELRNKR